MNAPNYSRAADLAALAQASNDQGVVDLTAYEAQRQILQHQSIDGLDATALVQGLVASPAYARPEGRAQIQPLLRAISDRLPEKDAERFSAALDDANVSDTPLERRLEQVGESIAGTWRSISDEASKIDDTISDSMASARQWAERARNNPDNSFLERAAASVASDGAGRAQELYGATKGSTSQALNILGDTVDLAKLGIKFQTDDNFRKAIIGAGLVYASATLHDPSKPVDDVKRVALKAWDEWKGGLEQATKEGKEREFLGDTEGRAGLEILTAMLPVGEVAKLGKFARVVDAADELAPTHLGEGVARRSATESAEILSDAATFAREAQLRGGVEADGANAMFEGLAGARRSQGQLRELVGEMKQAGKLDGLLDSGALSPKELNYLARTDLAVFDGSVPFEKALTAWVGKRELTDLRSTDVGDIGEAVVAHRLARDGYRDIAQLQNNSGHGNDLMAINPQSGRWEAFEVKASVRGIAREQGGDAFPRVKARLDLAAGAEGLWAPKNVWEEQAARTASRILDETRDPLNSRRLDLDTKWGSVNIERDPATGMLKAEPQIETWKTPAERQLERSQQRGDIDLSPPDVQAKAVAASAALSPAFLPASSFARDLRDAAHPGNVAFSQALSHVRSMEAREGLPGGENGERVAAAVALAAERGNFRVERVELGKDGQVVAVERGRDGGSDQRVAVDTRAAAQPVAQTSAQWLEARSPHYASTSPAVARTDEQARSISDLNPADQAMFAKIRQSAPAHVSDDTVAHAMLLAKKDGIANTSEVQQTLFAGDKLWVVGTTPGFRVAAEVSDPRTPAMADTLQHNHTFNQQRDVQLAQEQQRQQERGAGGPSLA